MIKERLSGHYLYFNGKLVKRGIVVLDDNQRVIDVIDHGGKAVELPMMRYLNGILLPVKTNQHDDADALGNAISEKMNAGCTDVRMILQDLNEQITQIRIGEVVSFQLLKGIDYKTMTIQHPVQLSNVKWLY